MPQARDSLDDFLSRHPNSVLVDVVSAQGSTPREAGAFMLVAADAMWGTIGGGRLEWLAVDHARTLLATGAGAEHVAVPLGPEIGQCCGGNVRLAFARISETVSEEIRRRQRSLTEAYPDVAVFGAGHVGRALAHALAPLPLNIRLIESRPRQFGSLPEQVRTVLTAVPEAELAGLASGSAVVILTHDHALDFLICRMALAREDLAYVGMIGSATKRATFAHWLVREGEGDPEWLARLILPIGGSAVPDKRPEVIAAMTAAEILTALVARRTGG